MHQYLNLLKLTKETGAPKEDRTGVGTKNVFGHQMRFDLRKGFPLVTTKKLHLRSIIYELLWMLRGDTNIAYLNENGVSMWDEWADENGDLGPIYGKQWRKWETPSGESIDQIEKVMGLLRNDPDSRRLVISAWNAGEVDAMALPPCHCLYQFYVADGKLSCKLYQRSADLFLGVPFNTAFYALLTHMIAHVLEFEVGDFIHTFGDSHIYTNHFEQVETQLNRTPKALPTLEIKRDVSSIYDFSFEDFKFPDYDPHPHIPGKVAV